MTVSSGSNAGSDGTPSDKGEQSEPAPKDKKRNLKPTTEGFYALTKADIPRDSDRTLDDLLTKIKTRKKVQ